mmetsp:Transcript_21457/g.71092  ORF Transcript_21457/g.71092 Transcript_21457/m.71092 type:complete len:252 (-) Transcript_21457:663-1418(-)
MMRGETRQGGEEEPGTRRSEGERGRQEEREREQRRRRRSEKGCATKKQLRWFLDGTSSSRSCWSSGPPALVFTSCNVAPQLAHLRQGGEGWVEVVIGGEGGRHFHERLLEHEANPPAALHLRVQTRRKLERLPLCCPGDYPILGRWDEAVGKNLDDIPHQDDEPLRPASEIASLPVDVLHLEARLCLVDDGEEPRLRPPSCAPRDLSSLLVRSDIVSRREVKQLHLRHAGIRPQPSEGIWTDSEHIAKSLG